MPKIAIAYIRKSTDTKDKQRFSIETQLSEIEIARQKAEIYFGEKVELKEVFIEKISGSSGAHRPEFQKVCQMFENKQADVLLSWKLDRLSRNHDDSFMLIKALDSGIIPCIQDSGRIWTQRDTGLQMYVALGLANEEAKQISERVKLGLDTMIKKGGIPFRPPFGAKNNKDSSAPLEERIIIDPIESEFARQMFEKRANGESYRDIADWLFQHGFKNKNGTKLSPGTIQQWIKNKFYYGIAEWNNRVWKHMYQPIIEKALWERANAVGRGYVPRLPEHTFVLKGLVKSAISGRPLTASYAKKIYPQYHTHASWKKDGDNVSISEAKIIEYFDGIIHLYSVPEHLKQPFFDALKESYNDALAHNQKERQHILSEITKTTNRLDGLIDLRVSGEISAEKFKDKQREYAERNVELEERMKKINVESEGILDTLSDSVELLSNIVQYWENSDDRQKLRIIEMICVELFVTPEKSLKIKENEVFEILRLLNCSRWLG